MKTFLLVSFIILVIGFIIWSYHLFHFMKHIDFRTKYKMDEYERQIENALKKKKTSRKSKKQNVS